MNDKFLECGRLWQLGPDWQGQRCGAKTRAGPPCKNPAVTGKARCRMHGGKSTGAKTAEGRARLSALHLQHGRSTTAAKAEAKRRAQVGREIRAELRDIEREAIAGGVLAKDWREMFDPKPDK
ncbi:HGGxSTG domain-containing protein [Yoonia sp.]|uniref:HGGxSTG domain-containing protein n=1 Tax=Yoonia sp. TaxID=2212373 RepID=UPI0040481B62